jgi:hypothetical protein
MKSNSEPDIDTPPVWNLDLSAWRLDQSAWDFNPTEWDLDEWKLPDCWR